VEIAALIVDFQRSVREKPAWVVPGLPGWRGQPSSTREKLQSSCPARAGRFVDTMNHPILMLPTVIILALLTALVATEPAKPGDRES
jgi:hypothetical protein